MSLQIQHLDVSEDLSQHALLTAIHSQAVVCKGMYAERRLKQSDLQATEGSCASPYSGAAQ